MEPKKHKTVTIRSKGFNPPPVDKSTFYQRLLKRAKSTLTPEEMKSNESIHRKGARLKLKGGNKRG